ncbi:MAG: hypothetical protein WBC98_09420, partial [Candidatus Zixiibacteriota bacterium]
MVKKVHKRKRLRAGHQIGGMSAENDFLLSECFYDNGDYDAIASRNMKKCFLIGRTGSGKTAILRRLAQQHPTKVIQIDPESLSLQYISNSPYIRELMEANVRLDLFFKALWKHVFIVEIIRHKYKIDSPEAKTTILKWLKDRIIKNPSRLKALKYFEEFGEQFWCDAHERVRELSNKFETSLRGDLSLPTQAVSAGLGFSKLKTSEEKRQFSVKAQQRVNQTQLARLNEMIKILDEEILGNDQDFRYVIVDDLDKEWVDDDIANTLIRCLFQSVVDFLDVKNLKILVALRTNIFDQLGYSERRRGAQEEKHRGLIQFIDWNREDLTGLLEKRIEQFSIYYAYDRMLNFYSLFPQKTQRHGDPLEVLLDHTLMRPRDIISLVNHCIRLSAGKSSISWQHIDEALDAYSLERLMALRDEWKDPYFDIGKFYNHFQAKDVEFEYEGLKRRVLEDVILLLADVRFRGRFWLETLTESFWKPDASAQDEEDTY